MIDVEEALDKILHFVTVLDPEEKTLLDCLGQVLAEDIYAPFDVPAKDNSAMDGYAVQAASIVRASYEQPKVLRVIGEIPAGSVKEFKVELGTSVRIMTGASIPEGADVVVPFEDTDEANSERSSVARSEISIYSELPAGTNIRRSGEDINEGEMVMQKGKILRPADLGVLASLGQVVIPVIRRPVVAILSTGNEVVDINQPLPPGKIYNSNTYSIAAQVMTYGGIPKPLGIAPDDKGQLTAALRQGLDSDLLITSGGVSKGDYDIVKDVLETEGDISFWTVRIKPGKPLAFGTLKNDNGRNVPHLGLPGNPVSSMIIFEVFARPAILKMLGRKNWVRPVIKATIEDSIVNVDGRRIFARAIVRKQKDKYFARLTGAQGSGILTSMVKANGLAIVPETTKEVKSGSVIDVIILDWDEVQDT